MAMKIYPRKILSGEKGHFAPTDFDKPQCGKLLNSLELIDWSSAQLLVG